MLDYFVLANIFGKKALSDEGPGELGVIGGPYKTQCDMAEVVANR